MADPRGRTSPSTQYASVLSTYDLSLDDFQHAFDPKIFIQKLTSPLFGFDEEVKQIERNADKKFDPRPYQLLFENAIDQLYALRKKVDDDIRVLIADTKLAESVHKNQLKELNNKFHVIRKKFQHLDQRISKVSHTAVRTGQQLEAVEHNRNKTIAGKKMIRQFLDFNTGDKSKFDGIFRDPTQLKAAARQIQQLQLYAGQFRGGDKTKTAKENIQKTAEEIENQLLDRFKAEMMQNNHSRMKELAQTLCEFQSQKVVTMYVNRVISKIPEAEMELKSLSIVNHPVFKDKAKMFFDRIISECKLAFNVIARVFPNPSEVCKEILSNIFDNRIEKFVHGAVQRNSDVGDFLLVLEEAHLQTDRAAVQLAALQQDLLTRTLENDGDFDQTGSLFGISGRIPTVSFLGRGASSKGAYSGFRGLLIGTNEGDTNKDLVGGGRGAGPNYDVQGSLAPNADGKEDFKFKERVETMFDGYRDGYLQKELELLKRDCERIIQKAILLDEKQRDELNDKSLFGRRKKGAKGSRALKQWVLSALDATAVAGSPPSPSMLGIRHIDPRDNSVAASSSHLSSAGMKKQFSFASASSTNVMANSRNTPFYTDENDGGQGFRVTERVLTTLTRALSRAERIGRGIPKSCARLAKAAWDLLLSKYISTALDLAEQVLPDDDPKEDPDTRFFLRTVGAINFIVRQMTDHYSKFVVPRLEADPNEKSRGANANRAGLRGIENRLVLGLGLCQNAALKYAEKMFNKLQRPGDFKPKDEMDCFDSTEACHQVSAFMAIQGEAAVESLQGRNLDAYLAELGRRFHSLVVTHLRKYQVSALGAMVVSLDVKRFQDIMQEFHIEEVNQMFTILRDMSSLLLLPVEQLGMVVQQRLASVPKEDIHEFLKCRVDYGKKRIEILSLLNL